MALGEVGETDWEGGPGCRPAEVRSQGRQLSRLIRRTDRLAGFEFGSIGMLRSEQVLGSLAKPQPRV